MIELTPRLGFVIVFILGLAAVLYRDRENVTREGIFFFRRTEKGIELIDRIASRIPRFWKVYGGFGVLTGLLSVIASSLMIGSVLKNMIVTRSVQNGPSLILPGLVAENQFQAGVSFIPVEYWLFGIAILAVVHEFSHGIVARAEDFNIRSVGWFVFGIFPGAFVEPEGEKMLPGAEESLSGGTWDQGNWKSRLKVLGAGSLANYLTAVLFFVLAIGVTAAATTTATQGYIGISLTPTDSGLNYVAQNGFPAAKAGMTNGTLESVNGIKIDSLEELRNVSSRLDPGENVTVVTSEGTFHVEAVKQSFTVLKSSLLDYQGVIAWLVSMLKTVALLNLLVGLFNMLPFKPLDGGLMVETLLERFTSGNVKHLDRFSLLGWTFILASILLALLAGMV